MRLVAALPGRGATIVASLVVVATPSFAFAQTAGMMSFQALIKDSGGTPIVGPHDFLLEIIDNASPTPNVMATFTQSGVTATAGVVSTKYGPVSPSLFDGLIPGGATRRLRVTVTSLDPDLVLAPVDIITPPAVAEQLNARGTGTPAVVVTPTGNVGIGTASPQALVHVVNSIGGEAKLAYVASNFGVFGFSIGGSGVFGDTVDGSGVRGHTTAGGIAVHGTTEAVTGIAMLGGNGRSLTRGQLGTPLAGVHGIAGNGLAGLFDGRLHVVDPTPVVSFTGENDAGVRIDGPDVNDTHSLLGFTGGISRNIAQIGCLRQSFGSSLVFGTSNDYSAGITNRAMVIDPYGHVGIGVTAPTFAGLHVGYGSFGGPVAVFHNGHQSGYGVQIDASSDNLWSLRIRGVGDIDRHLFFGNGDAHLALGGGRIGIGTTTPGHTLSVNGTICSISGTVQACSDSRFKTNVASLDGALATLEHLRPVSFNWRVDEFPDRNFDIQRQIGFIAQEVLPALPEIVQQGSDGYYSVDYGRLTPLLTAAVQELNIKQESQSASLQMENAELRKRVAELEARLGRVESLLAAHGESRP